MTTINRFQSLIDDKIDYLENTLLGGVIRNSDAWHIRPHEVVSYCAQDLIIVLKVGSISISISILQVSVVCISKFASVIGHCLVCLVEKKARMSKNAFCGSRFLVKTVIA